MPLDNRYSPWTTGLANKWFLISFFGVFAFHFWLASVLPPAEDELYYWAWAQDLGPSYYDHPPLVAYLISISTRIFGDSILAIRLFACLLGMASLWMLTWMESDKRLLALLLFSPIFLVGSVLMTPDIPLLFFWTAYLYWFYRLGPPISHWHEDPISRVYRKTPVTFSMWFVGGVLLGFGLLSKYTMLLALPCGFFALALKYRWPSWLPGFVFHLGVAFVISSPVLGFNIDHGFSPFLYQWQHGMTNQGWSPQRLLEFVGIQGVLLSLLPFLFLPVVFLRLRELYSDRCLQICLFFYLCPLFFFLYRALRTPTEANWPLIAYIGFWPIVSKLYERTSFRGVYNAVFLLTALLPFGASALIFAHWHTPLDRIPAHRDRFAKLEVKQQVARNIATDIRNHPDSIPVFTNSYQWTSYLRYQGIAASQLKGKSRPSHFTLNASDPCQHSAIWLLSSDKIEIPCFTEWQVVHTYPLTVRDTHTSTHFLSLYRK